MGFGLIVFVLTAERALVLFDNAYRAPIEGVQPDRTPAMKGEADNKAALNVSGGISSTAILVIANVLPHTTMSPIALAIARDRRLMLAGPLRLRPASR